MSAMAVGNDTMGMDTMMTGGWDAISKAEGMQAGGGAMVCYPANGEELVTAVIGTACTVIMLTRNYFDPYEIKTEMIVTGRKVVIGNPLTLPLLEPVKIKESMAPG